ncbi:amidohydrolase family protein [Brevibacterium sp. 5221]|uniref:Amidohydrolase family protein n=1 Tax=Brevibacterium rongguiense TaxID=2695267 RepID=A0A6N9HAZ5_9MICO|nr:MULTISPECIES: amidohydrolase [Brevibacterium]MYM20664.1 amidohydrolase family protein [Brevibacterium rongguiense]WAL40028.1 amidohydrolase [Brevibacterium sp. BRM-1]
MYTSAPVPQVRTTVLVGARVYPIADADGALVEPIDDGAVVLREGRIARVGPRAEVLAAVEAEESQGQSRIVDVTGCALTPGLFESHGHVGVHEDGEGPAGNDTNESIRPDGSALRALDGINPADVGFADALRGGVTTALIKPGSANPIGGRTAALKTWGRIADEMLISQDLSVKSALGENPKRFFGEKGKAPSNRMGVAREIREAFTAAQDYRAAKERAEAEGKAFDTDLGKETLVAVLEGRLAWDQHCHRADDIATAVRLADEFGYRLIVNHGTEGHFIADFLAERGIDVIVGPLMTSRSKVELRERTLATPAVLEAAGVRFALTTDHPVVPINFLIHEASLAVKEGLSPAAALASLTVWPAQMFGLEDRIGTLEPGSDADVVVWSGDPLALDSRALRVFVDGREVYSHEAGAREAAVADPFGPTPICVP